MGRSLWDKGGEPPPIPCSTHSPSTIVGGTMWPASLNTLAMQWLSSRDPLGLVWIALRSLVRPCHPHSTTLVERERRRSGSFRAAGQPLGKSEWPRRTTC